MLSVGELSTVLAKYLATLGPSKNEALRDALNTFYGTTNKDLVPLLAKAIAERQA